MVKAFAISLLLSAVSVNTDAFAMGPPSPTSNNNPQPHRRPPPLPKTQNAYTLLGFDWLSPPADFDIVHRAYREMARM